MPLERQDLPCTYLAHHELESVNIIIVINALQSWRIQLRPARVFITDAPGASTEITTAVARDLQNTSKLLQSCKIVASPVSCSQPRTCVECSLLEAQFLAAKPKHVLNAGWQWTSPICSVRPRPKTLLSPPHRCLALPQRMLTGYTPATSGTACSYAAPVLRNCPRPLPSCPD